jgi:hypothetical protein
VLSEDGIGAKHQFHSNLRYEISTDGHHQGREPRSEEKREEGKEGIETYRQDNTNQKRRETPQESHYLPKSR